MGARGCTDRTEPDAEGCINDTEIRVVGMSRSGNHAIIGWILAQARGRICFLNCAEPKTNPFVTARPLGDHQIAHEASYDLDLDAERRARFSRKDYLVHSYEDTFLRGFGDPRHERRHDQLVGRSARRVDLLILRDPYNLFASRFASRMGEVAAATAARVWCQHAREYLGLQRNLKHERVPVSFNAWAASCEYRHELAAALGLDFDDASTRRVPGCAGGSSFDGTSRDGAATRMAVLDRWRAYGHDPEYASLFTPTLRGLSQQIFGHIAGTEAVGAPAGAAA